MRAIRPLTASGSAAWLRAMFVVLLLMLVVPALALADDAGTAVAEPPVAEQPAAPAPDPAAAPPVAEAPPAEPVVEPTPADPPVAIELPPLLPAPDLPPILVPPVAVTPPAPPAPVAAPPTSTIAAATPAPEPATPTPAPTPTVISAGPITVTIPATPIVPTLPPVLLTPVSAPAPPEIVPVGPSYPTDAASHTTILPAAPPDGGTSDPIVAAAVPAPPTPGVSAALGIPNTPLGLSFGPPEAPSLLDLATPIAGPGAGGAISAAAAASSASAELVGRLLSGGSTANGDFVLVAGSQISTPPSASPTHRFGEAVGAALDLGQQIVAPLGYAPAGSSLLAVLAGYILPGGAGAPASTLVLFIVIGLILGVTYAGLPRLTERLGLFGLLADSLEHRLAVRRPG